MVIIVLLVTAGLAGLGGGGTVLHLELTRAPTRAEIAAAGTAEIASRWQRLPAGQIFPATIRYLTAEGMRGIAYRVGIAPRAPCERALIPAVAKVLRRDDCVTVLRATYVDRQGFLAAAVGVAVMRDTADAVRAANRVTSAAGFRAARFASSWGVFFRDAQRGWSTITAPRGPYVFLVSAGYTDGRPGTGDYPAGPEGLGSGVLNHVIAALTSGSDPCARTDIRC
jgi:hypothetical protein